MPTGEVNYENGMIYTIRSRDSVYVGSTTNFSKRKNKHKSDLNKPQKLYQTIRDNGGEWDMKPYKLFPCNHTTELKIEEERIRKEINADLNMNSCYGLDIENILKYREEHKEHMSKQQAEYYQRNKEQILKYKKKYSEEHKEQIKKYREEHKEHIKKYMKKYSEKKKEKITCECGSCVNRGDMARHKRTKKHKLLLEQK
tara:strand:- start:62 stop:658 length:597 start_codon:yes stop_codon:yes gene_type:complete